MNALKQPDVHPDVVLPAVDHVREVLENYPSKKAAYDFAELLGMSDRIFDGYATGYEQGIEALEQLDVVCQKSSPKVFSSWREEVRERLASARMQHRSVIYADVERIGMFVHYNPGLLIATDSKMKPSAEVTGVRVVEDGRRGIESIALFSGSVALSRSMIHKLGCDTSRLSSLAVQRHIEEALAQK